MPKPFKFDVLKHEFVPRHEIMSEEEVEELMEEYEISKEQLPRILNTDPGALSVRARPGDVLKITRKSDTAGKATAYRLCVEASDA
jgi:DNA-directed RNA polymerase subunit H